MFITPVCIPDSPLEIGYHSQVLALGSCFAENIGGKMQNAYFLTFINPFGVLYNPLSVARGIRCLMDNKQFTADDLFQTGSLWHSFMHSSAYSATTQAEALQKINSRLLAARYFLSETRIVMLTLGTAWVYEYAETGDIVANCHKLPSNLFNRRQLNVDEIVNELTDVIQLVRKQYPQIEFLFTISPIRHLKDGAHGNTVSKATLHLAVDALEKTLPQVHYFPAYEIVMDELRDYRFYASDMFHPSDMAVDYIWQRFSETYFSEETLKLKKELEQLRIDFNHRPLHSETDEYKAFRNYVEQKRNGLIHRYPFLKTRLNDHL